MTFDINAIKAIPIADYLKDQGVEVKGNRCAAVWRGGTHNSVSIGSGNNLWFDHKTGEGGTIIDLCVAVERVAVKDAIAELSKRYNISKIEGAYVPPQKPTPRPDFIRISWAVKNRDIGELGEVDLRVAKRVIELANGATDEATLNAAIEKVVGEQSKAKTALANMGIVFEDADEFVQSELPPPIWIVRDFIAVGMKGDLCGGSKTNKSFLVRQLALCVASGQSFLDAYAITEPHKVACLDLELFPWNSQERMRAQARGLCIDWNKCKGNFLISHLRGRADELRDAADELVNYLLERGVEFVVIDPRYKLLKVGEDENTGEGLRGILQFRDALSAHFATLIVTHDPKGDTSQKKTTDRGAGSYTAGADFDFRLTIDKAAGWRNDNRVYVVEAEGRARPTPSSIGVKFWDEVQTFYRDEEVRPVKLDNRVTNTRNAEQRAVKEATMQKAYRDAAIAVVVSADDSLLSIDQFDAEVAKRPDASLGVNLRGKARKNLVKDGTLATCAELERKTDGRVVRKKQGYTFISTPDRIAAYRRRFGQ